MPFYFPLVWSGLVLQLSRGAHLGQLHVGGPGPLPLPLLLPPLPRMLCCALWFWALECAPLPALGRAPLPLPVCMPALAHR